MSEIAGLKAEKKELIIVAQNQSLPTRNYQTNITKNGSNQIFRLCKRKKKAESFDLLVSSCPILTLIEYKEKHNKIGHYIHWKKC